MSLQSPDNILNVKNAVIRVNSVEADSITVGGTSLVDLIYPLGAIYITTSAVSPSSIWAGTTWVAYGEGRTLVGIDSGDTDFDSPEETGGAKTHTLTTAEMPSHTHTYLDRGNDTTSDGKANNNLVRVNPSQQPDSNRTTDPTGGDQPHNNLQPYIVTYMWKRTA